MKVNVINVELWYKLIYCVPTEINRYEPKHCSFYIFSNSCRTISQMELYDEFFCVFPFKRHEMNASSLWYFTGWRKLLCTASVLTYLRSEFVLNEIFFIMSLWHRHICQRIFHFFVQHIKVEYHFWAVYGRA